MTYEEYLAEEEFLCHHGIKGQRWGIRRTPEQLGHYIHKKTVKRDLYARKAEIARKNGNAESYNKYLKKKREQEALIEKAQAKMPGAQLRQDKWEQKQIRKEEKRAEKEAKAKDKFIRTASTEELLKNQNKLTDAELSRALERLKREDAVLSLARQQELAKSKQTQDKINNAIGFADSLIKGFNKYEDVARVVNKITGNETLKVFSDRGKSEKNAIINSMDYNTIMSNKNKLSTDDLNKALDLYYKANGENKNKAITAMSSEMSKATDSINERRRNITSAETARTNARTSLTTANATTSNREMNMRDKRQDYDDAKEAYRNAQTNEQTVEAAGRAAIRAAKDAERRAKQEMKDAERRAEAMDRTGNVSATNTLRSVAIAKAAAYNAARSATASAEATAENNLRAAQRASNNARRAEQHAKDMYERSERDYNEAKEAVKTIESNINKYDEEIKAYQKEIDAANNFINQTRQQIWRYETD